MNETHLTRLKTILSTPLNVVIVTHKNPDGDALGSSLGLCRLLTKSGHRAMVVTPNDYPDFLRWMPGQKSVLRYDTAFLKADKIIEAADLVFCLDFNDPTRMDKLGEKILASKAEKVLIDHHRDPLDFAQYVYCDHNIGSTCEMIYHFAHRIGILPLMDKEIAECIYTGIMTDTGSFRFPSTTASTHRIVADLIDKGADGAWIYSKVFDDFGFSRFRLMGTSLSNMVIIRDAAAIYMTLTQDELDRGGFQKGDTEGFVNMGLSVKGVNLSGIFIENREEGIIKVSLRSKGNFSVNELARGHFNGGGHINAAGGMLPYTDMEKAIALFRSCADRFREDIVHSYE